MTTLDKKVLKVNSLMVRIKPSLALLLLVSSMHLLALLALKLTNLTFWLVYPSWALLSVNLAAYYYRWHGCHNLRLQKFHQHWKLIDELDDTQTKTIIRCYYWSRWLIILEVEQQNRTKQYLPLLADMCKTENFHCLKIISRFELN